MATHLHLFILLAAVSSCGNNLFQSAEEKDPAEDATIQLEKNNPQAAIDILEAARADDPDNVPYISVLALAYAQRAGLDPLTLAQKMASNTSDSSSESSNSGDATPDTSSVSDPNEFTSLFSVLPPATASNISDMDNAASLMTLIPEASFNVAEQFKMAIFQTAAMALKAKALDKNGDGEISADEILDLSSATAASILTQIATAASAFSSGGSENDEIAQLASQQLGDIQDQIATMPGSTDEEKLKNYLASSGTDTSSLPSSTSSGSSL